jgi:hypothetical protein
MLLYLTLIISHQIIHKYEAATETVIFFGTSYMCKLTNAFICSLWASGLEVVGGELYRKQFLQNKHVRASD